MIVLTPGVFVEKLHHITLDEHLKGILNISKLYPIELYVGGICGNVGIQKKDSNGIKPGVFTLFLRDEENQKKWMSKLRKATSCYNIKDFYDFKYSSKY